MSARGMGRQRVSRACVRAFLRRQGRTSYAHDGDAENREYQLRKPLVSLSKHEIRSLGPTLQE
jgi:hypothetical protein